jgi:hypothetical protein
LPEQERKHTDELQRFNKKEEKKIRPCDLGDALKMLGKKSSKVGLTDLERADARIRKYRLRKIEGEILATASSHPPLPPFLHT